MQIMNSNEKWIQQFLRWNQRKKLDEYYAWYEDDAMPCVRVYIFIDSFVGF